MSRRRGYGVSREKYGPDALQQMTTTVMRLAGVVVERERIRLISLMKLSLLLRQSDLGLHVRQNPRVQVEGARPRANMLGVRQWSKEEMLWLKTKKRPPSYFVVINDARRKQSLMESV